MRTGMFTKRILGAAAAFAMCLSSAALPSVGTAVCAEPAEEYDLSDNGIPVLYISIDEEAEGYGTIAEMNESPDHSVECTGTVRLDVPDGYTGDYSSKPLSDTSELKLSYIRGRGNSTWGSPKKPYKIKLDKSTDLLGMGKNKHWVLLANYSDDTMLRNRITSYIGNRLGLAYTPQMLPVDVVMNGDYLGSYYLSEQVRVGNSRVDIDELKQSDNEEPEVTGGYLLAMGRKNDEGDEHPSRHIQTKDGEVFYCESPEFYIGYSDDETGTEAQFSYISNYMQNLEDAVLSDDFKDKNGVSASEYLDYTSTASYWWVNNFLKNFDAYATTSTYLYKERSGKLFFGPLWDFDQSMTGSSTEGFNDGNTLWLNRLRAYEPEYQQILLEKWEELDGIITDIVKEDGVLDRYIAEVYLSEQDNEKRWKVKENYAELGMDFDYLENIEELRSWLKERQQWVRDNIDLLLKARVRVTYMADGEVFKVSEQDYMSELAANISAPLKDGYVFTGWKTEDGEIDDLPPGLTDDITLYAKYIPEEEAVMADDIFLPTYEVWFDLRTDGKNYSQSIVTVPEDAQERVYEWTSSDPSVAEVDIDGTITPHKVGDTVVTVKLRNGVEKKIDFHVYDSETTPTQQAEKLTCESDTITVKVGEYAQIIVSASPAPNKDTFFFFSSDDTGIIELIDSGVFLALAPGEATVTIEDLDGLRTTCRIIVVADESSESEPEESETESSETEESLPDESSSTDSSSESSQSAKTAAQSTENPKTGAAAGTFLLVSAAAAMIAVRKCSPHGA